jgi:hypothetical protein
MNKLIECVTSPPILAYPDYNTPFVVHTDASQHGLGAVLYQKQEGTLRVIAYASRTLTPAERNYHLHAGKLEFLALKWSITEQFRDYLYYSLRFIVYTDNNPLTYVLSTAKLNATGLRWIGELSPRGGPGKLRGFWEDEIHVVVSRKGPESPVYDIKSESGCGKIRTLHRNLLLPCDYLPPDHGVQINESVKTKKSETSEGREKLKPRKQFSANHEQVDTDSDSEGEERPSALPNDMKELNAQQSQHSETFEDTERNAVTPSETSGK